MLFHHLVGIRGVSHWLDAHTLVDGIGVIWVRDGHHPYRYDPSDILEPDAWRCIRVIGG